MHSAAVDSSFAAVGHAPAIQARAQPVCDSISKRRDNARDLLLSCLLHRLLGALDPHLQGHLLR